MQIHVLLRNHSFHSYQSFRMIHDTFDFATLLGFIHLKRVLSIKNIAFKWTNNFSFTIALVASYQQIVPLVLHSFSDQDSRVRYYACEALDNIAKVVRGDFIVFFNQIFDALCKLSTDSDANAQSAAHLLDRLVKVIFMDGKITC
ncbi:Protein VAC14 homolog [Linum perenne]